MLPADDTVRRYLPAMGTAGYLISSRSVFLVTFLLAIPTLLALGSIRESEVDVARCHGAVLREDADAKVAEGRRLYARLKDHLPPSTAAKLAAELSGAPRKALYGGE